MNSSSAQNLLYTEHLSWLKVLAQSKVQLVDLETRLALSLGQLAHTKMLAQVESFQNRLIKQREVVDELRHEIKQHENHLERMDQPSHLLLLTHVSLREEMVRFYDLYLELQRDFDEFLA
ncbi:MAG: hypothetical protein FGM41_09285 [Bacteroidetes bacterium]|jgi:hypothetical protein|nr:hypothetical protein [Bacteroidota bacterium]